MSTTYTGIGANVAQSLSPTETIPADGDALASASVTTPLKTLMDHIALIWAGAFTGPGTTPGLSATAGGGGAPVRGALALTSQATPSAPINGDTWCDGAALVAAVGGISLAMTTAAAQMATGNSAPSQTTNAVANTANILSTGNWAGLAPRQLGSNVTATTTAGSEKITVAKAGWYRVNLRGFVFSSGNTVGVYIVKNSILAASAIHLGGFSGGTEFTGSVLGTFYCEEIVQLAAGDWVAPAVSASIASVTFSAVNMVFSVQRIG